MTNGDSRISSHSIMAAALLAVLTAGLYFYNLDEDALTSDAEARILLTAREMSDKSTWLAPTGGGEARWEKPPLYVWAVKLTSTLRDGEISPLVARIPSAVSALLLVLLGAWWIYQHLNRYPRSDPRVLNIEAFALLGGLMLATTPEIMDHARKGTPDAMFAFLCFAALYCLGESFETRRSFYASRPWRQWVLAAYFFIGLAIMTNGPVALLFVLLPYGLTCMAYRMTKPDAIHLGGLAIALLVGGWWYVTAIMIDPAASDVFYAQLITRRFGEQAIDPGRIYFYLEHVLFKFFPWNLLAAAMVWRNLRHVERTPTLLTWTGALVGGLVWLSLISSKRDAYFLPVAPFIPLLAADAVARWNFESRAGAYFRRFIRTLRWAVILIGAFYSIFVVASDAALILCIGLALFSLLFAIHRWRTTYVYALWERTVHSVVLLVVVFYCIEALYVRDYVPHEAANNDKHAFAELAMNHLPADAQLYYYGEDDSALYSYFFDRLLPMVDDLDEFVSEAGDNVWLLTDEDVDELMSRPRLSAVLTRFGGSSHRYRSALFRVIPESEAERAQTLEGRYRNVPPLRLGVIGNAGSGGRESQKDLGQELQNYNERTPFHEILVLGDSIVGDTSLEKIDFHRSFERGFGDLIEQGVPFLAILGDRDRERFYVPLALLRYRLFQMQERTYYTREYYEGLIEYFAIDTHNLAGDDGEAQRTWLEERLAQSEAKWKIVGMHEPILSLARDDKNNEEAAEKLLPLLDRYKVDLALWADEPWYQRVKDPEHAPVFIGAGWSGRVDKDARFLDDRRLKAHHAETTGFVALEISPDVLRFRAIDVESRLVDRGSIRKD